MKLNRIESLELKSALLSQGLKAKHISGENFIKLINLIRNLKKKLTELCEVENDVAIACGGEIYPGISFTKEEDVKLFNEKLAPIHKDFVFEFEGNFIPEDELKEYTKEQDTSIIAVLFEHLLKS